jgi:hypothetical protein
MKEVLRKAISNEQNQSQREDMWAVNVKTTGMDCPRHMELTP